MTIEGEDAKNQTISDQMKMMRTRQAQAIEAINQSNRQSLIPSSFMVGSQVWLEGTHLHLPYQATKLAPKQYGPFEITKEISPVAYQLCLPIGWNIHNVFHALLLSPYHETTAHGPNYSRPPPDLIEGEEEYEVEKIINHQHSGWSRTLQYLIKWKGYPEANNTWEPADQVHALELIKAYHRQNPLEDKRSRRHNKESICSLSYILTCQLMALSIKALNPPCQQDPLPLKCLQGKSERKSSMTCTPFSLIRRYKGCWDQTSPSSVSWPKYKEAPYPPDWHEMSSRGTRTSTLQYSGESSTQWQKLPERWRIRMPSKKDFLKRPSTTSSE